MIEVVGHSRFVETLSEADGAPLKAFGAVSRDLIGNLATQATS
jgi:hypothetical protein